MNEQDTHTGESAEHKETIPVSIEEILAAFEAEMLKPVQVSFLYRIGLVAVAVAMALLPAVYLGLIGATGWAVHYHATENTGLLSKGGAGAAFAYLAPLTVGVIAVLFMIKPLFAGRAEQPDVLVLGDDEAPALRAFVKRICRLVGAPEPVEIEVNCEVNAAASFRRGWLSLFGHDLKLIVGLPLVAGMDLRSFGGVLAHEFGHFAQGAGMRLTFVIRNINAWFARVVYERDQWDAWLEATARSIDLRIGAALYLAMLFVWLTRRVLWILMWLGHVLSCFALRHMEYDADTWEARFAGSKRFAETSERLQLLGLGQGRAMELLGETWKEKRLAANLPDFVREETDEIPAETIARFKVAVAESTTRLLDTHPADVDRIAEARKLEAPGVFHLSAPATVLFENWEDLAGRATRLFYKHAVGDSVTDDNLIANERLRGAGHAAAYQACERYFLGRFSILRPLFIDAGEIADDLRSDSELTAVLVESARGMKEEAEGVEEEFGRFDRADASRMNALQAEALIAAGRRSSARIEGFAKVTKENALLAVEEAAATMRDSRNSLAEFDRLAKERLSAALALSLRNAAGEEAARLLAALGALKPAFPTLLQMRESLAALGSLFDDIRDENEDEFIAALRQRSSELAGQVKEVRGILGDAAYPFDHASGAISLARFISVDTDPEMDPIFRRANEAEACMDRLLNLYLRVVGSLALLAEKAEGPVEAGALSAEGCLEGGDSSLHL